MKSRSKNYNKSFEQIKDNVDKKYTIEEAVETLKKISFEKFDPSIQLSLNLNVNTKHADQQLRGSVVLPNGTGKSLKSLVVDDSIDGEEYKKMGANFAGGIEMLEKVKQENWFEFDVIITTPKMMPKIAKYGKLLGPKGLMPNPKLGTVTPDIKKALDNVKKGQLEYRTDQSGIINLMIGKKSFETNKIVENYEFIFNLIKNLRPSSVKGEFIKSVTISTTMSPGLKINFA